MLFVSNDARTFFSLDAARSVQTDFNLKMLFLKRLFTKGRAHTVSLFCVNIIFTDFFFSSSVMWIELFALYDDT